MLSGIFNGISGGAAGVVDVIVLQLTEDRVQVNLQTHVTYIVFIFLCNFPTTSFKDPAPYTPEGWMLNKRFSANRRKTSDSSKYGPFLFILVIIKMSRDHIL